MERTKPPKGEKKSKESRFLLPPWVFDALINEDNPAELIILYSLYNRTVIRQHTNRVWATNGYCIRGTKLGKERFARAKRRLIELGLIEVIKGKRHDGHFGKDFIKVNYNVTPSEDSVRKQAKNGAMPQCTENSTPSYNGVMPRCTETPLVGNQYTNTLKKVTITNTEKIDVVSSPTEKITSVMFDRFYRAYPNQKFKGKARTAWNKLCAKDDRPTKQKIMKAIALQKKTPMWSVENGRYIPHPANWLNNNGWEDDPKDMIVQVRPSAWLANQKPFITDDGIRYNLCPDGEYRDASGNIYIE